MERGRARYRFVNEAPNWRYQGLIFDEEPEMVAYRRHMQENGDWERFNAVQPEHLQRLDGLHWTLMTLPAARRRKEARRAPYQDPKLADYLLKESEKDLARAIAEAADERARTAEWIADALLASCKDVSAIRARSRTLQAAIRQLVGQPRECDLLFRAALDDLAECPDPEPRAPASPRMIPRLDGVRRALLRFRYWADACSASVELLLAYARTGTRKRKGRPDVFGELAQAFQKEREPFSFVRFDYLPFAEDREPLEAALRGAAELLETRRFPEAAACRTFLDHVQSLPPSLRAEVIRRQAGWGCPWRRRKPPKPGSRKDLIETSAMVRRPGRLPDDEERHDSWS